MSFPEHTAVILFAHGSPVAEANEGVAAAARSAGAELGAGHVVAAFLDSAPPSLAEAVAQAVAAGARRVVVMPFFLTMGLHLRRDLPRLVDEVRARHPQVEILVSEPLEGHAALVAAVTGRVREALAAPLAVRAQAAASGSHAAARSGARSRE